MGEQIALYDLTCFYNPVARYSRNSLPVKAPRLRDAIPCSNVKFYMLAQTNSSVSLPPLRTRWATKLMNQLLILNNNRSGGKHG